MSLRIGIFGLVVTGFMALASVSVSGCGGAAPATVDTAVNAPTSEMDYQKQQEAQRKANLPRGKSKSGAGKVTKKKSNSPASASAPSGE